MHKWERYLQDLFNTEIPLTAHMAVRVVRVTGDTVELHAAAAPNVNIHGTAFAGSLYSLCALAAWGLLHIELKSRDLAPDIVLADSTIVFHAPVVGTLCARSHFADPADLVRFVDAVRTGGRSEVRIPTTVVAADVSAASFTGTYAVAAPGAD